MKRLFSLLLIVVILPFVGSLVYWAMRKPGPDELRHAEEAERSRREQAQHQPFDSTFGT